MRAKLFMNAIILFVLIISSFMLCSCSTDSQLSTSWKSSIAQLQITPIMPLRERIEIGESYRYLKKPSSFYTDGQIEPGVAIQFNIDPKLIKKDQSRKWPTFTYDENKSASIGASLNSIATFSGTFGDIKTISLKIEDSYSERVEISQLLKAIAEKKEDKYYIISDYEDEIDILFNLHWESWSWEFPWYKMPFKRNVLYLRIPTEVYYAEKVNVTLTGDFNNNISIKSKDESKELFSKSIKVEYSTDNTISLTETLKPPMAVGYRGVILKVWKNDETNKGYQIEEYLEDAEQEFWSDL